MIIEIAVSIAMVFSLQGTAPAQDSSAQNVAQATAAQGEGAVQEEVDKDNEMECRRVSQIGTRFKKRVCATRKQWRDLAERSRTDTENIQRGGQNPGAPIDGGG